MLFRCFVLAFFSILFPLSQASAHSVECENNESESVFAFMSDFFQILFPVSQASVESIEFGDNESQFANDSECDDRRFVGLGMATSLDEDDNYHDANDCRRAYELGAIRLFDAVAAKAATSCDEINFGNNESEYADDGECDDFRFEGPGTASILIGDDLGSDARDCRTQCAGGRIYLRDYD